MLVNVTNDEGALNATLLKKLLMTRTGGGARLERTEIKINLSEQFLMWLNKLLTTKLSRKKFSRSIILRVFSVPSSSFGISFSQTDRFGKFPGINAPDNEEIPDTLFSCYCRKRNKIKKWWWKRYCRHFHSTFAASVLTP